MGCNPCKENLDYLEMDTTPLPIQNETPEQPPQNQNKVLRSKRTKKVNVDALTVFNKEINKYGKIISGEDFDKAIGKEYKDEHIKNPYLPEENTIDTENLVEPGPVKLNNGTYYKGTWNHQALMHGQGEFLGNVNGANVYVDGIWENGVLKKGKVMTKNNKYTGDISDGNFNGNGVIEYADQSKYEGEFKNGLKHGPGKVTFPDGTTFCGDFNKGEIGNRGELIWENGITYNGELKNGIFNGNGTLANPKKSIYEGKFLNGIYHGKGKFTWLGDKPEKYEGEYFDGKKSGYGIYTFADDTRIEGNFEEGELHGDCTVYTPGYKYTGEYVNGCPVDQFFVEEIPEEEPGERLNDFHFELKKEDINIDTLPNLNTNVIETFYRKTVRGEGDKEQGLKFSLIE